MSLCLHLQTFPGQDLEEADCCHICSLSRYPCLREDLLVKKGSCDVGCLWTGLKGLCCVFPDFLRYEDNGFRDTGLLMFPLPGLSKQSVNSYRLQGRPAVLAIALKPSPFCTLNMHPGILLWSVFHHQKSSLKAQTINSLTKEIKSIFRNVRKQMSSH